MTATIDIQQPSTQRRRYRFAAVVLAALVVVAGIATSAKPAAASSASRIEFNTKRFGPVTTYQVSMNREATRRAADSYSAIARQVRQRVPGPL